jgi:peptidoglycan/xylan/chitin deacetylase (PgdA/CDA1 family)
VESVHLGYHYVRNGFGPGPTCSPDRLRQHIVSLQKQGYEILACGEIAARVEARRPLPAKHATLSFDDCLKDQYTIAYPILQEYGVPGTFFVITSVLDGRIPPVIGFQIACEKLGCERLKDEILPALFDEYGLWSYRRLMEEGRFDYSEMKMGERPERRLIAAVFGHFLPPSLQAELIEKMFDRYIPLTTNDILTERFMSAEELTSMAEAGMEIAAHTVSHPWLNMVGVSEIAHEALDARIRLERTLSGTVETFAWTFGGAHPRKEAQRAVREAGYVSAWNFWAVPGAHFDREPYENLFDIPRSHEQLWS